MARLPAATMADRPPVAPGGASLLSSTGSPLLTALRVMRPSSAPASPNAPGSMAPAGQSVPRSMAGVTFAPTPISTSATITVWLAGAPCPDIQRAAASTAAPAISSASSSTIATRLFLIVFPLDQAWGSGRARHAWPPAARASQMAVPAAMAIAYGKLPPGAAGASSCGASPAAARSQPCSSNWRALASAWRSVP
ncbi:hypothetical protein D3C85_223470 [compost metagenome]